MSYDVTLQADTGGLEPVDVYWRNMTSNVAPMWRKAGCDLAEFEGKPATELAAALRVAIGAMGADMDAYRAMNPSNGWGDADSCLGFLAELLIECDRHPKTTVHIWR